MCRQWAAIMVAATTVNAAYPPGGPFSRFCAPDRITAAQDISLRSRPAHGIAVPPRDEVQIRSVAGQAHVTGAVAPTNRGTAAAAARAADLKFHELRKRRPRPKGLIVKRELRNPRRSDRSRSPHPRNIRVVAV